MSRRQQKRERMRIIIINAAREAFSTQPYDNVNMDEIADKALLSRATLYNYFDNKETLYFEIGVENYKEMQQVFPQAVKIEPTGLDKAMKLSTIVFQGILRNSINFDIVRHFMGLNNQAEHPIEETYDQYTQEELDNLPKTSDTAMLRYFNELRKYMKIWYDIIEIGQEDGTIRDDLQPDHLAQIIQIYITGVLDQMVLVRRALEYLKLPQETVVRIMLENLRKTLEP
ncbi:MAG: TetR/AcrR family transcriptional regulator [Candidatus Bathyarchaeota archaeon]|nr:TetR/AcrR family transcriptional regulator [Candidatus Bathyarchaeota archaeon]